jgi:magnesium transporter
VAFIRAHVVVALLRQGGTTGNQKTNAKPGHVILQSCRADLVVQNKNQSRPLRYPRNMQALSLGRVSVPVPSPAVLRFLKIQAECLPFVASQSQSQVRRHHHHAAPNTFRPNNRTCLHDTRAPLNTVQQHSLASSSRGFWNSAAKSRWQRPWQQVRPKKTSPLQPNDLPAIPRLLDDAGAASLGRIVKPTNELRMRCTEFDGNGNVTLINGAFKKSELIAKVLLN